MPSFGTRSRLALLTVDPVLVTVLEEAVKYFDFSVLEGHRGEAGQNAAFDAGLSKKRWPDGKHNGLPSEAVDVAPFPIDWKDTEAFIYLAGFIVGIGATMGVTIRSGADWDSDRQMDDETFRDYGHLEVVNHRANN